MDALNPNYNNSNDYGYKASDSDHRSKSPGNFLGLIRSSQANHQAPEYNEASYLKQNEEKGSSDVQYYEPTPVYKGSYSKLSPLSFNTIPVDDAANTKLERSKFSTYDRAQLFFLLRLERFLRLRQHWLDAMPRSDETWKTDLVLRSVFSAFSDCQKHGVGEIANRLIKDWGCC